MKINSSHLVGAAIALAAVFLCKLDAQDVQNHNVEWEYAVLSLAGGGDEEFYVVVDAAPENELRKTLGLSEAGTKRLTPPTRGEPYERKTILDQMGRDGWQLCGVEHDRKDRGVLNMFYYFKRTVQ